MNNLQVHLRARSLTWVLFAALLVLAALPAQPTSAGSPAAFAPAAPSREADYIVFEQHSGGSPVPVYYAPVTLQQPLVSLDGLQMLSALSASRRDVAQFAIQLKDAQGTIVFQDVVSVSPWLRGEFHPAMPEEPIDGHILPQEVLSFVVRVPRLAGTTLFLQDEQFKTLGQYDMLLLTLQTERIALPPAEALQSPPPSLGPAANRVDMLVMGDGYTAAQAAQFASDAAAVSGAFFNVSPLSTYQNYFNVYTLFTASSQSGSDHPPYNIACGYSDPTCCGDTFMQSDPLQGTMVNTAFDSRFCAYWIHRLVVADNSKVYAAAAAVPDWDTILLIVNDPTYGGSGGAVATVTMNSASAQVAQHEFGHSFVWLADEYSSPYPGYPSCSDVPGSPLSACESNVTDLTVQALIKWNAWILPGTIIPTPNNPTYSGLVGLFEGARYQSSGMYRSGYNCIMRSLGYPFCQVPSQSFVLKLYQGGWGVPASGIRNIEPGNASPPGSSLSLTRPITQQFQASLLGPAGGPALQVAWLKNGVPIPGETGSIYTYNSLATDPALVNITLQVSDATALVHPTAFSSNMQSSLTWAVTALSPFADTPLSHWAYSWIERLFNSGITTGCNTNPLIYCPEQPVSRAEMAVFLVRGVHGTNFVPPVATGIFSDVPTSQWAANYIEQLYADGITTGCNPVLMLYCPSQSVTRAEMAAFLLRARHGAGYAPPAAIGVFSDVPTSHWAAAWIEQLYAEGITTGCNHWPVLPGAACDAAEMAAFLVRTFGLP